MRAANGDVLDNYARRESKDVLDPRVAYVLTTMMEAVVNSGTGYPVRGARLHPPAAGKTGTSHDAWFAGYTSNLLCIVWVGNDDYTDVEAGGRARGRAHLGRIHEAARCKLPQYSDTQEFTAPDGIEMVNLDKATNLLSDAACPDAYDAAFLNGTAPTDTCDHPPDHRNIFQKIFGIGKPSN